MNDLDAVERGFDICRKIGVRNPGLPQAVEVAIIDAARTENRVPDQSRRFLSGYRRTIWPGAGDGEAGPNPLLNERILFVTPDTVSNAEHVLSWNGHVRWGQRRKRDMSDDQRKRRAVKIMWLHAGGMSFAAIGRRFGIHRSTALRIYRQAIRDVVDAIAPSDGFQGAMNRDRTASAA